MCRARATGNDELMSTDEERFRHSNFDIHNSSHIVWAKGDSPIFVDTKIGTVPRFSNVFIAGDLAVAGVLKQDLISFPSGLLTSAIACLYGV
jgi:hypothetical protein